MAEPEEIVVTLKVIAALDALEVPYLIAGSLASVVYGIARSTVDADLVADLRLEHVAPLAAALIGEFYVEADSIREAIRFRRSFNAIHRETMFKVDVFIPKPRAFDRAQFEHRVRRVIGEGTERSAWMASAEDTVLAKLEWYRMGGQVSERQWRDVLGVLKTQQGQLDVDYLRRSAPLLGIADLLERALAETET